jgi:hypothetical protein
MLGGIGRGLINPPGLQQALQGLVTQRPLQAAHELVGRLGAPVTCGQDAGPAVQPRPDGRGALVVFAHVLKSLSALAM